MPAPSVISGVQITLLHSVPCDAARKVLEDLHGNYYFAERDAVEQSRTSVSLRRMFEAHQPAAWFFGHYHVRREFMVANTLFRCLAELELAALETTRTMQLAKSPNEIVYSRC